MSIRWARAAPKTATFDTAQVIDFRDGVLSEYNEPVPHEVDETTATDLRRAAVLRAAALPPSRTRVAAQAAAAGLARMAAPKGAAGESTSGASKENSKDNPEETTLDKMKGYVMNFIRHVQNGIEKAGAASNEKELYLSVKKALEKDTEGAANLLRSTIVLTEAGSKISLAGVNGAAIELEKDEKGQVKVTLKEDGEVKHVQTYVDVEEFFEKGLDFWDKNVTEVLVAAEKKDEDALRALKEEEEASAKVVPGGLNSKFSLSQIKAVLPDAIADVQREMGSENDPKFTPEQLSAVVREVVSEMGVQQDEIVSSLKLKEAVRSAVKSSSIKSAEPSLVNQGKLATVSSRPAPPATLLARLRPLD